VVRAGLGRVDVTGYDVFAPFYDAVQGERAEHAAYLRSLIEKHRPGAKTVLELACGTGSILKQLRPHYHVVGVDRSEPMLEVARRKVAGVRVLRADMTQDDNLLVLDVTDGGKGVVVWDIRIFEHLGDSRYRLHAEDIREISFPAERITAALSQRFSRVWTYDAQRARPSARSERLHFVCR